MAFESVVCPQCSATDGFTMVEPNTYYCPYHKGLFKHVDSSRIKVQIEGFCHCGRHMAVECRRCHRNICGPELPPPFGIVYLRDFGYLLRPMDFSKKHPVGGRAANWVTSRRQADVDAGNTPELGPVMFTEDMFSPITQGQPGQFERVCSSCVTAERVPAAFDAIIQGRMCYHPRC
jgi:hypothetical protein